MIQIDRKLWQEPDPGAEWHMWRAVLFLAVFDLSNASRRDEALAWIMDDAEHVGSAGWICTELSLDLEAVRRRALAIYDGNASITYGKTRRNWQRRVNRDETFRKPKEATQ